MSSDKPIRVLHVVESWPPVISGYTSRSARIVAAQHVRTDIEPFVAVTSRQHMYRDDDAHQSGERTGPLAGVDVHVAPVSPLERRIRRFRRYHVDGASFERWLDKELLRVRPDVVHVHWSSSIGRRAVRAGHRHGVPVIAETRFDLAGAMNAQTFGGRLEIGEKPLRRHFERHLLEADAVVAASRSLGRLIEQHTGVAPTIIENAVDPVTPPDTDAVAALRASLGVDAGTLLVGCVSKMLAYEGFDRIIDIVARLRAGGADVRAVLVGDGPELESLRTLARRRDIDLISPGNVDPSEVGTWYGAIDLVVVPRRDVSVTRFASPLKVIEAMSFGRPIVASAVGDVEGLLADDRGAAVAPDDDHALFAAVTDLLGDPSRRRRFGTTAREWSLDHHTWDLTAERLRAIYAETMRARHTPGRQDGDAPASDRFRDPRLTSGTDDRADRVAAVGRPDADGRRRIVVIGAGPAGLTAALDAARETDLTPVVIEASPGIGGLSRTVDFNGNLIDIGGHRFFSKSERVTNWWLDILPLEAGAKWRPDDLVNGPDPHVEDQVMLVRSRRSQILWNRRLFDYPLDLSFDLIRKLGYGRTARAGASYLRAQILPVSPVTNLEDFYINRFGRELYRTFFESYTEKVWGLPCREISPDWGAQRVKGLSLWGALWHAIKPDGVGDAAQRDVATSLVERFLYPKFGPGQMWETAASQVLDLGGEILTDMAVIGFEFEPTATETADEPSISSVRVVDRLTGQESTIAAEQVVSTMPLSRLVDALGPAVSDTAHEIADGLSYRDFITVGVLVDNLRLTEPDGSSLLDNWLYIQEPDVLVGRLQIFNNWSPWMVADPTKSWVGLEYFCNTTDPMWSWSDDRLVRLAGQELASIGVIEPGGVLEGCAIRVKRAYPSYIGTYDRLDELQPELTAIPNLWCAGRNGQHRYNNQDHSMLASMMAIDQIASGDRDPDALWSVNIDDDYHEDDNG